MEGIWIRNGFLRGIWFFLPLHLSPHLLSFFSFFFFSVVFWKVPLRFQPSFLGSTIGLLGFFLSKNRRDLGENGRFGLCGVESSFF